MFFICFNNKVRIILLVLVILGSVLFGYVLFNGSFSGCEVVIKSGEIVIFNFVIGLVI